MLRSLLKAAIPTSYRARVRDAVYRWRARLRHAGLARFCPVCRSPVRGFLSAGVRQRPDARCPVCGAFERHRLIWLYLRRRTDLFHGRRLTVLHVAPEKLLADRLRRLPGIRYVSVDLMSARATVRADLTCLAFADGTFDGIYCSHVLEHIQDDRAALTEMHRVLRPGGWTVLQVPIVGEATQEDPRVVDPGERERRFGQRDHVRVYGRDFADRVKSAGFEVDAERFAYSFTERRARRFGLDREETVFLARRPSLT